MPTCAQTTTQGVQQAGEERTLQEEHGRGRLQPQTAAGGAPPINRWKHCLHRVYRSMFHILPHPSHLAEVAGVVLVPHDAVVVLATGVTAAARVLAVLADTAMARRHVAALLAVGLEACGGASRAAVAWRVRHGHSNSCQQQREQQLHGGVVEREGPPPPLLSAPAGPRLLPLRPPLPRLLLEAAGCCAVGFIAQLPGHAIVAATAAAAAQRSAGTAALPPRQQRL